MFTCHIFLALGGALECFLYSSLFVRINNKQQQRAKVKIKNKVAKAMK
jgi:hypothetical protein